MGKILLALLIVFVLAVMGSVVVAHEIIGEIEDGGSGLHYDSDLNDWYDNNGIIVGGQSDGMSIDYLRNNPPVITEDGSLE